MKRTCYVVVPADLAVVVTECYIGYRTLRGARAALRREARESAEHCRRTYRHKTASVIAVTPNQRDIMIGGRQSVSLWERLVITSWYGCVREVKP